MQVLPEDVHVDPSPVIVAADDLPGGIGGPDVGAVDPYPGTLDVLVRPVGDVDLDVVLERVLVQVKTGGADGYPALDGPGVEVEDPGAVGVLLPVLTVVEDHADLVVARVVGVEVPFIVLVPEAVGGEVVVVGLDGVPVPIDHLDEHRHRFLGSRGRDGVRDPDGIPLGVVVGVEGAVPRARKALVGGQQATSFIGGPIVGPVGHGGCQEELEGHDPYEHRDDQKGREGLGPYQTV